MIFLTLSFIMDMGLFYRMLLEDIDCLLGIIGRTNNEFFNNVSNVSLIRK